MDSSNIPILMYHSIAETGRPALRRFAVSPFVFGEHLRYLRMQEYTSLTVTELAAAIRSGSELPARCVVLTFDDGYADFYSAALPLLRRCGFTATLYVSSGLMADRQPHPIPEESQMLNGEQLRAIAAEGIEIASHGEQHVALDTLSPAGAAREITQSKAALEKCLQRPVTSFAYPYGYTNRELRNTVERAGYLSACAVRYARSSRTSDLFALERLIMTDSTHLRALANLLTGEHIAIGQSYRRLRSTLWQSLRNGRTALIRTRS